MIDLNLEANRFLYDAKLGDYYISGEGKVEVIKRTKKRIHLSNGIVISIGTLSNGVEYLTSKSIVRRHKSYPIVNQIIRDIEGYLLYKIHSNTVFD
jgi:hypothetical protein